MSSFHPVTSELFDQLETGQKESMKLLKPKVLFVSLNVRYTFSVSVFHPSKRATCCSVSYAAFALITH